jgi:hypothetical protein
MRLASAALSLGNCASDMLIERASRFLLTNSQMDNGFYPQ